MKNPPHPGKVVRVSCLEPLGLNITEGAKVLGVSRQALSRLVNGHARMSIQMAVRLAKAFLRRRPGYAYRHPMMLHRREHARMG